MKKYFAMIGGTRQGPFTLEELASAGVGPDTYIWCKGMDGWEKARTDADICREFRRRITDILHPSSKGPEEYAAPPADVPEGEDPYASVPVRFRRAVRRSGFIPGKPVQPHDDLSKQPPSYLVPAILVTILCFPLTGLLAIFAAVKSMSAWKKGNAEEAYEMSRQAKMWSGITFFMGFIVVALALAQFIGT